MSLLNFYLLRHAKAVPGSLMQDDKTRELAERGRNDAESLGAYLFQAGITFDLIHCSNAVRTRETLEYLQRGYGKLSAETRFSDALYHAAAERMLEILQDSPLKAKHVLMIGHNPGISELAAHLAKRGDEDLIDETHRHFPTCSLAVYAFNAAQWADAGPHTATIKAFLTPKQLQASEKLKADTV